MANISLYITGTCGHHSTECGYPSESQMEYYWGTICAAWSRMWRQIR